jgi:hypothetical protein
MSFYFQKENNILESLSVVHYSYRIYCVHLNEYRDGTVCEKEPGSSVSIVSGYGLEDRAIEVRSPTRAEDISSSLCVQTSSGAHPASCTMGTGGKAPPGRDADHSPPSSAEVLNE